MIAVINFNIRLIYFFSMLLIYNTMASRTVRMMHGGSITPMGGSLYPIGGSLYPLGSGMPIGGARGRRYMPFDHMKWLYSLPTSRQVYGSGLAESFKSVARKVSSAIPKSVKTALKSTATAAVNAYAPKVSAMVDRGISSLPASAQPVAKLAKSYAPAAANFAKKKLTGGAVSELGGINSGQMRLLAAAAESGEQAPAMDRHQYNLLRNVVRAKSGRGMKKM